MAGSSGSNYQFHLNGNPEYRGPTALSLWDSYHNASMGYTVIEDIEDRVGETVIRRKIIQTDDAQFPSGYRYALHYGYTDGRGTILRYDNENETPGRHERHTSDTVEAIDFPGMLALRQRFINEVDARQ